MEPEGSLPRSQQLSLSWSHFSKFHFNIVLSFRFFQVVSFPQVPTETLSAPFLSLYLPHVLPIFFHLVTRNFIEDKKY
jgi:hypothetical protein